MVDTVAIQIPRPRVREGSSFTATAYFRTGGSAATPTNVYYRIDNLTSGRTVANWTPVTAASNISIGVTASHNGIHRESSAFEILQLIVDADHGLGSQVRSSATWEVENVGGVHCPPGNGHCDEDWLEQILQAIHPLTAAENTAGVLPTSYAYPPDDARRYGLEEDGTTNNSTPLTTMLSINSGTIRIPYSEIGSCKLDTDVTPSVPRDVTIAIDPRITFSGAGHLLFDDIIPFQHDPTWTNYFYRKTYDSAFDYYYGSFLLGALVRATSTSRSVAVYGLGQSDANGSRAWGSNLIGSATADGAISVGLEINAQVVGAGNTSAAAYSLVIAASGDLPVENAIQIQADHSAAPYKNGINFDMDPTEGNVTGALIRCAPSGAVSCQRFLHVTSNLSATTAEVDLPSFTVLATQANTVNRLAVRGGALGTSPRLSPSGSDTNLDINIVGKGTGGVILADGASVAKVRVNTTGIGFNGSAPIAKPTITGSRGGNAALASLLTALASMGLITDGTSA